MRRLFSAAVVLWMAASAVVGQARAAAESPAPAAAELTRLLNEFLAGASRSDAAVHERFWADDLVYTRSAGRRIGKADILKDVRSAPKGKPGDPTTAYSAEDVRIQQYAQTAIVAFRLVGTTKNGARTDVSHFLNTGTFVERSGKWQAVAWQSTRMARPEEDVKRDVAAAQAAFDQALLTADVGGLEALLDAGFVWTQRNGDQVTRQQLLDQLKSGQLKYGQLATGSVTVSAHGDTAVVRAVTTRQRTAVPGASGTADAASFTAFLTVTYVNDGGGWKAVAMHSSRS